MYRYQFQVDNKKVFPSQPKETVSLENNPLGREGLPFETVRNIFDIEDEMLLFIVVLLRGINQGFLSHLACSFIFLTKPTGNKYKKRSYFRFQARVLPFSGVW